MGFTEGACANFMLLELNSNLHTMVREKADDKSNLLSLLLRSRDICLDKFVVKNDMHIGVH